MKVKATILLLFHLLQCCIAFSPSCQFDIISEKVYNIPRDFVDYKHQRAQRQISDDFFPLRIHIHFGTELEFSKKLIRVLEKVTHMISQLLYVKPVQGPLLLQRLACGSRWSHGPNKGLCSSVKSRYKGEFCENKIDRFKIPPEHLQKLDVFDYNASLPVYSMPAGQGTLESDYILYVSCYVSNWCQKQDIQAYASYCRLDQFGRPIAGFINFCPNYFNNTSFDDDHYLNVAVHELFHALGFSKDLFYKFVGCPIGAMNCEHKKNIIIKDSFGIQRLTLPSVVQQMQAHFNCEDPDFGAPLDSNVSGLYTSHWDPLLMYGSIMAPSVENPEFTTIDPITLAVFADTGWYKVNFSAANTYHWGKGEGCKFGIKDTCSSSSNSHLCRLSHQNNSFPGCDFLHYTQTTCQLIVPNRLCGVFQPNVMRDCRTVSMQKEYASYPFRCFQVQHHDEFNTVCAAYKCKSQFETEVLLNNSWVTCSYNKTVKNNDITLYCPNRNLLCQADEPENRQTSFITTMAKSLAFTMSFSSFLTFSMLSLLFYIN